MSDCQRLLEALRTGPKSASELYGLHMIVHSRVADLRKRGHLINCSRVGNGGAKDYWYVLVREAPLEAASETQSPGAAALSGIDGDSGAASSGEQLTLVAAA